MTKFRCIFLFKDSCANIERFFYSVISASLSPGINYSEAKVYSFDIRPNESLETVPGAISVIYRNNSEIRVPKNGFQTQAVVRTRDYIPGSHPTTAEHDQEEAYNHTTL